MLTPHHHFRGAKIWLSGDDSVCGSFFRSRRVVIVYGNVWLQLRDCVGGVDGVDGAVLGGSLTSPLFLSVYLLF